MQRKATKPGAGLGKTTGWIHRLELKKKGVKFYSGVDYQHIDTSGLWISDGQGTRLIAVDSIVICAGQNSETGLAKELAAAGLAFHIIGGAHKAAELDAKRAIADGTALADRL